jgi:hypothetical protein
LTFFSFLPPLLLDDLRSFFPSFPIFLASPLPLLLFLLSGIDQSNPNLNPLLTVRCGDCKLRVGRNDHFVFGVVPTVHRRT